MKLTKHGEDCLSLPSRTLDLNGRMDGFGNHGHMSGVCYQSEYQRYLQPCSSTTIIEQGHAELNYSNKPLCFADPLSLCHNFNLFIPEFVFFSDVSRCIVRNTGQKKTRGSNSIPVIYYILGEHTLI